MPGGGNQPLDDAGAAGPGLEGQVRLMVAHIARQAGQLAAADVGRIADHKIEAVVGVNRREQVALHQRDAIGQVVTLDVAPRDFERLEADVDCRHLAAAMPGGTDGDGTAAGADIGHAACLPRFAARFELIEQRDDQQFGLRSGNQHRGRHKEIERVKLAMAHEIGDRRASGPAPHQVAEAGAQLLGGDLIEVGVQLDALAAFGRRQQNLGVEPGLFGMIEDRSTQEPGFQVLDLPFPPSQAHQMREQLFERDAALEARERGAEAVVDPESECDVVLRVAVQIELVPARELALVAVGGSEQHEHRLPLLETALGDPPLALARDGEGARKFVEVTVTGAESAKAAQLAKGSSPAVVYWPETTVDALHSPADGREFTVMLSGQHAGAIEVERIIGNVGYGADHTLDRQLRVTHCPITGAPAPASLAAEADHGGELQFILHEPNFYVLGAKSQGQAGDLPISQGLAQIKQLYAIIGDRATLDLYATMGKLVPPSR